MSKTDKIEKVDVALREPPYKNLHIYLIDGIVGESDEISFGESFIGNWIEEDSSFLFFSAPANVEVTDLVRSNTNFQFVDEYSFSYEEWQGGGFDTIKIDNFLISPPWVRVSPLENDIPLILDPGVVFGNGLHPTTRDCLRALEVAKKTKPFDSVLDLGTGTGILSLAAARLGAKRVTGVDLNPLCVKTAKRNVLLNGLEKKVEVILGKAEDFLHRTTDLLVANIHFAIGKTLLERKLTHDNEMVVLSGLMRSQAREVKSWLAHHHLRIIREWDHDMIWFTFLI